MTHLKSLPQGSLLQVSQRWPELFKPLLEFHEILLRGPSPLSEAQRESLAAYVSGLNDCRYCRGVHVRTAEKLGTMAGFLDKAIDQKELEGLGEAMEAMLAFAGKLTKRVEGVDRQDVDELHAAGLDDEAVLHVVLTTALFNLMNRLVEGLGIDHDPEYAEVASYRLAERGYLPLLRMMGY